MYPRLWVIVPSCRPEGAARVARFWLTELAPHPWEIRLLVLQQNRELDPWGQFKTAEAMDLVPKTADHWIIPSADDTVHSPRLAAVLGELVEHGQGVKAIAAGQDRGNGWILRPSPGGMRPGHVCGGQVALRADFLGERRPDVRRYRQECDGHFLRDLYLSEPCAWRFIPEVLFGFNSLERPTPPA